MADHDIHIYEHDFHDVDDDHDDSADYEHERGYEHIGTYNLDSDHDQGVYIAVIDRLHPGLVAFHGRVAVVHRRCR